MALFPSARAAEGAMVARAHRATAAAADKCFVWFMEFSFDFK